MVRRGVGPWWTYAASDNMARKSLTGLSWSDTAAAAANNNGRTHSRSQAAGVRAYKHGNYRFRD
ncbi:hypothetical protein QR685DRAFT_400050, partial [Neurospora intermedia]